MNDNTLDTCNINYKFNFYSSTLSYLKGKIISRILVKGAKLPGIYEAADDVTSVQEFVGVGQTATFQECALQIFLSSTSSTLL